MKQGLWYNRMNEAPALLVAAEGMDNLLGRSSCPVYHTSAVQNAALTSPFPNLSVMARRPSVDSVAPLENVNVAPQFSVPRYRHTSAALAVKKTNQHLHLIEIHRPTMDCTQRVKNACVSSGANQENVIQSGLRHLTVHLAKDIAKEDRSVQRSGEKSTPIMFGCAVDYIDNNAATITVN